MEAFNKVSTKLGPGNLISLKPGQTYYVKKLRMTQTKYGPRAIVELDDLGEFFLTPRASNFLKENGGTFEQFEKDAMNNKLTLKYVGGGNMRAFEFIVKD